MLKAVALKANFGRFLTWPGCTSLHPGQIIYNSFRYVDSLHNPTVTSLCRSYCLMNCYILKKLQRACFICRASLTNHVTGWLALRVDRFDFSTLWIHTATMVTVTFTHAEVILEFTWRSPKGHTSPWPFTVCGVLLWEWSFRNRGLKNKRWTVEWLSLDVSDTHSLSNWVRSKRRTLPFGPLGNKGRFATKANREKT